MEGFALSAVTLAALSLPGLIVYYTFVNASKTWEVTSTSSSTVTPKAAAFAVVGSLIFHSIWGLSLPFIGYPIHYKAVFAILTESDSLPLKITEVEVALATGYLTSQCAAAWLVGWLAAKLAGIKSVGIMRMLALSSDGALWHRLLQYTDAIEGTLRGPTPSNSRPPDDIVLTIELKGSGWLYKGFCNSYQLDSEGRLRRVELKAANRKTLASHFWDEIAGESFVVLCDTLESMEVDYLWFTPDESPKGHAEDVDWDDS